MEMDQKTGTPLLPYSCIFCRALCTTAEMVLSHLQKHLTEKIEKAVDDAWEKNSY